MGYWLVLGPSHVSALCIQCRGISAMYKGKGGTVHAMKTYGESSSRAPMILRPPHKRSVLPSVLTAQLITAQLYRECWKIRRFVQLKFLDCVTLGMAEDLTAQFTLDCSVCLFPQGRSSVRS